MKLRREHHLKLIVFVLVLIAAYFVFRQPFVDNLILKVDGLGYIGLFIAGLLFPFGFLAPFSAGFFLAYTPNNLILAALVGGLGALASDMILFSFVKHSFKDDFEEVRQSKFAKRYSGELKNYLGIKLEKILFYALAVLFIGSPLPDEIGLALFAGITRIEFSRMAEICFVMHTIGIFILLSI